MPSAPTRVVTGKVRLSYVHVFEPFSFDDDGPAKYSVMLLVPKSDKKTIAALRAAEESATQAGAAKWGGKTPKNLAPSVIRDGDDYADEHPERAGCWFLNASTRNKPGVVDADVQPILDQSEVYSGCYARVSLTAFAYAAGASKGVSFGLGNIQKIADGESLGGATRAEEDFDPVDDDLI